MIKKQYKKMVDGLPYNITETIETTNDQNYILEIKVQTSMLDMKSIIYKNIHGFYPEDMYKEMEND